MEGFLDSFDPETSTTPARIFNPKNESSDFECVPVSLMEQVTKFLDAAREDLRYSMEKDMMTIKNESLSDGAYLNTKTCESETAESLSDVQMDFQKKISLHKHEKHFSLTGSDWTPHIFEFPNSLYEMEKEDLLLSQIALSRSQAREKFRDCRQQFILVASLVDRIPNLAGLARTCEVFKATGLVVADASITHDKQFQLISVTAEKWIPVIEVPVSSLKVYLERKRLEGFSILGLEQTANSIPLDQYLFPTMTVLVLGREKEGIPVDIIHILDACVEIPQLGVIRSLNVHVSGAIALWEYIRQQRCKPT